MVTGSGHDGRADEVHAEFPAGAGVAHGCVRYGFPLFALGLASAAVFIAEPMPLLLAAGGALVTWVVFGRVAFATSVDPATGALTAHAAFGQRSVPAASITRIRASKLQRWILRVEHRHGSPLWVWAGQTGMLDLLDAIGGANPGVDVKLPVVVQRLLRNERLRHR